MTNATLQRTELDPRRAKETHEICSAQLVGENYKHISFLLATYTEISSNILVSRVLKAFIENAYKLCILTFFASRGNLTKNDTQSAAIKIIFFPLFCVRLNVHRSGFHELLEKQGRICTLVLVIETCQMHQDKVFL